MKNLPKKILLIAGVLMAVICIKALAQNQEGNVTVHIIQETEDGTIKLKRSYGSAEELKQDPNLVEFEEEGGNRRYTFRFQSDSTNGDKVIKRRSWSDEDRNEILDSIMARAERQIEIIRERRLDLDSLWEERDNVVKELRLRWDNDTTREKFGRFFDSDFFKMEWLDREDIMNRLDRNWKDFDVYVEEFSPRKDRSGSSYRFSEERKRASIVDLDPVADAGYIKSQKYDHAKAPLISGLKLEQDHRPGRYILSFYFPKEEPMTLRLTTLSGEVVYVEGLALFKGRYERSIHIDGVNDQTFYLEINEGKKTVIKKVEFN